MAKVSNPRKASKVATRLAMKPTGAILPYPTVVKVWELKKKTSIN